MNNKYNFFNIQMIVEAGVMLALAFILSQIKLGKLPQGGSITLASMFPIILFSIRWGALRGILVGVLFGVLSLIIDPQIFHPAQVLLDYPIPFGFIGLSGISLIKDKKSVFGYLPFVIISHLLRLAAHIVSGIVFFSEYTPEGMTPFQYSLTYNASYMIPELGISILFLFLLWKPLSRLIKKQDV